MTRPVSVLHLHETPRDASMIRVRLEAAGVSGDVHPATSNDSFETALAREAFDLVIADCDVPGYDGVAVLASGRAGVDDALGVSEGLRGACANPG